MLNIDYSSDLSSSYGQDCGGQRLKALYHVSVKVWHMYDSFEQQDPEHVGQTTFSLWAE